MVQNSEVSMAGNSASRVRQRLLLGRMAGAVITVTTATTFAPNGVSVMPRTANSLLL